MRMAEIPASTELHPAAQVQKWKLNPGSCYGVEAEFACTYDEQYGFLLVVSYLLNST